MRAAEVGARTNDGGGEALETFLCKVVEMEKGGDPHWHGGWGKDFLMRESGWGGMAAGTLLCMVMGLSLRGSEGGGSRDSSWYGGHVYLYHFISDRYVTRVQPGDNNFMDKTASTGSNIIAIRFAHAKNRSYIFPPFLRSVREENSVSIVF